MVTPVNKVVFVSLTPGEWLQQTLCGPRHGGTTPGVMVKGAISYDNRSTHVAIQHTLTTHLYVGLVIQPVQLPFMNSIQGLFPT